MAGRDAGPGTDPRVDEVRRADVVVVGTGVAGLAAALGAAPRRVALLTKSRLGAGGSSPWAQGGIAAAVGADDAPALHAADTLAAGAGLNDPEVVDLLAEEGPRRIRRLIELGTRFDRDAGGRLALGREAAHGRRRILHARGDATGAEIVRALSAAIRRAPEVEVFEEAFAIDLAIDRGEVSGVLAVHRTGRRVLHLAPAVVLATGGLGRLYSNSTNPPEATGDGLAMAARAGARLVDLEFVQFHPTALAVPGEAGAPLPLLTEALRGEGAVLLDERGRRFMPGEHPDAELAPRDVVARAIWRRLAGGGRVFLDASRAVGERFPVRFPTVFALCRERGLDPRVEPIPVAPAAHYHMGGIAVDENGRTSLPGLWACGEVAATGAHGANRLASNSLLEALVFGARVAEDLAAQPRPRLREARPGPGWLEVSFPSGGLASAVLAGDLGDGAAAAASSLPLGASTATPGDSSAEAAVGGSSAADGATALVESVRRLMWERVGLVRDAEGLTAAVAELDRLAGSCRESPLPRSLAHARDDDREDPAGRREAAPADARRAEVAGEAGPVATPESAWEAVRALGEAGNLLLAGRLVAAAALARRESRGGHFRSDCPRTDPAWRKRLFLTVSPDGTIAMEARELASPASETAPTALAAVR